VFAGNDRDEFSIFASVSKGLRKQAQEVKHEAYEAEAPNHPAY
jgi:hypothetical protein